MEKNEFHQGNTISLSNGFRFRNSEEEESAFDDFSLGLAEQKIICLQ